MGQTRWDLPSSDLNYMKQKQRLSDLKIQKRKKDCKEGKLHYQNHYKYPKKNLINIDTVNLGRCFLGIYQNYHENTEDFFNNIQKGKEDFENLFSYLAGNKEFQYKTGKELALRKWIREQLDNSISPHELFKQSLKLNQGNLFYSILTIHELLRNEARYFADYIDYDSSKEQFQSFYNKFVDIRGDLEERCDGVSGGDHAGSWYRIWGTMLDSMNSVVPKESEKICNAVEFEGAALCYAKGCFVSSMAEIIKPLYWDKFSEVDNRKASINRVGYGVMDSFYKSAQDNIFPSESFYCNEYKYLTP